MEHHTTITQSPTMMTYWWTCTCGDEGGPFEYYNHVESDSIEHERSATS